MGMLIRLEVYSYRDLQNTRALLQEAAAAGQTIPEMIAAIDTALGRYLPAGEPRIAPAKRRRPDNLTTCKICGKPAVIVPLVPADRTLTATHAIQCQNRPAKDQPWRDGMCGHTEYIVRGEI